MFYNNKSFFIGRVRASSVSVFSNSVQNGDGQTSSETHLTESGVQKRTRKLELWRQRYLANLRKVGLDMEEVSYIFSY